MTLDARLAERTRIARDLHDTLLQSFHGLLLRFQTVSQLLPEHSDAKEKLDRLPSFVKPMVQSSVEAFARKQGYQTITLQVMDDSKSESSNGMTWTPEAEKRLENIPDFIRPMARKEVERVAKERGMATITAQVMDDAKDKFMKFM